ncbi:MAG: YabP/YqfC family sporulation protein [bacterium]|nr:YabP/YqfC family sporulation protein [bacterium]MDY4098903.1 YabP/YqfC family sporulation protein [Lachnospiraceae bacterium]
MIKKHRASKNDTKRINGSRERLAQGLELPKDVSCGVVIVTVTGRRSLVLENYRGIVSYDDDCIVIQTKECRVSVSGCRLKVDYYTNEEMKIVGLIHSISYEV